MNFSHETKVKDIVVSSPAATRILERAGVDYCCGGHNSLRDACADAGASAEEILERLRTSSAEAGPADAHWVSVPLRELTQHIRENHHHYVREALQRVRSLLKNVKSRQGRNHPEIAEIEGLFLALGQEMIAHMQKEEQILFPYIEALERSANGERRLEPPFFQTVRNPIQAMMKEHDSARDLVMRIRAASSDYNPPADACGSLRALYQDLREFETDLHQHVHLENNILFPRAVNLEEETA